MYEELLKLSKIDVLNATKQFSDMIVEKDDNGNYKTYFLNGSWGSGKTTFLKDTEENPEGKLVQEGWSFRYLNLWEIQDERSVFELAFSTMFPGYSIFYKGFSIFCIVISLLLTPIFNLGLSNILNCLGFIGIVLKIVCTILGLSVSVFEVLKLKSDSIYISLFNKILGGKNKKIVLVVDDFDRVPLERQKETYRLFNVIHDKIPVIFVGDLNKLTSNNDISVEFLTKIIDRRVELPVAISSKNVLKNYSLLLERLILESDKSYDREIFRFLNEDFKQSSLTLREIKQFNNLLRSEMSKKQGRVRIKQLIVIVYLYLFDYQKYCEMVNRYDNENKSIDIPGLFSEEIYRNIEEVLFSRYTANRLPLEFQLGPLSYFINDNIVNLSIEEADEILKSLYDDIELINELNEKREEFLIYLGTAEIELEDLKKLLQKFLLKIEDEKYQDLISSIVEKIKNDLRWKETDIDNQGRDLLWISITNELDIPKKCYFYIRYQVDSYFIFQKIEDEIIQYINNSKEINRKPEVAYCLLQGNPLNYIKYKNELKKIFPSSLGDQKEIKEFVSYFNIYKKVENIKVHFKFQKNVDVTSFIEFVNKELLKVGEDYEIDLSFLDQL